MIVDTDALLRAIEYYEDSEVPDWETCPISTLNAAERRALNRREVIERFCALAEEFGDSIVESGDGGGKSDADNHDIS